MTADQLPQLHLGNGDAQVARQLSEMFATFSSRTQDLLDRQRQVEGANAGAVAASQEGFVPRNNDASIRGQAFYRAATSVYLSRLDRQSRANAAEVWDKAKGDPKALQAQLELVRRHAVSAAPPELREDVEASWERIARPYVEESTRLQEKRLADQQEFELEGLIDDRALSIEQMASMSEDPEAFGARITDELASLRELLIQYGPAHEFQVGGEMIPADLARPGLLSPARIDRITAEMGERAVRARVLGQSRRLKSWSAKQAFALDFRDDFVGSGMESTQHQKLSDLLQYEANLAKGLEKAELKKSDRADKAVDEEIRASSSAAFVSNLASVLAGSADDVAITAAFEARDITAAERGALQAIADGTLPDRPDMAVAADLMTRASEGDASVIGDLTAAILDRDMDSETAMRVLTTLSEPRSEAERLAVQWGMSRLSGGDDTGIASPKEAERALHFQTAFNDAMRRDPEADPDLVAANLTDKILAALPPPKYLGDGKAPDLAEIKARILEDMDAGTLTPDQAADEINAVIDYLGRRP